MNNSKTMEEISVSIRRFLMENYLFGYEENELGSDASFMELGVIDSTGVIELVALIERDFNVEVEDYEIIPENFDSINSISSYVYKKLNGCNGG